MAAGPRIAATWGGRWARRRSAGQHGFRPGPVARGASCSPHRWAGSQQRPAPLAAAPRSATDLSDLVEPRCRPDISTAMYYLVLLVRGGGSFCTIGHACPVALKSLCRVAPCRQAHHVWQAHHVRQAHRVRQRPTARGTRAELSPGFAARLWLASWVQVYASTYATELISGEEAAEVGLRGGTVLQTFCVFCFFPDVYSKAPRCSRGLQAAVFRATCAAVMRGACRVGQGLSYTASGRTAIRYSTPDVPNST